MEINNNLTYKKRFDIVSNLFIQYGTRGRTRTVMISLSVDFESTASTNFATRASGIIVNHNTQFINSN